MGLHLTFPFSLEKTVNALAFFAASGVRDLTKLKAAKLLYLADRHHFLNYGRPISGDRYIVMDLGPVPENTYQLTTRLIEPDEVADEAMRFASQRLQVLEGILRRYPVMRARRAPDLSVFSESEINVLEQTVREFGSKPARDLVNLSHDHRAYKRADVDRLPGSSVPLPYEFFLDDASPEQAEMLADLTAVEQENRETARALQAAARAARATHQTVPTTRG
ncbi:MAG TPA: Panacea domain-containing protein [Vicinamibacterales bacterium]|nr:Panacea domain-containing protein [Vicinamibacterales bacterium]